jgi:hypothetical protein
VIPARTMGNFWGAPDVRRDADWDSPGATCASPAATGHAVIPGCSVR